MPRSIAHLEVAYLVDPARVETINVLGPTIQFLTPSDETRASSVARYQPASPSRFTAMGILKRS